MSSEETKPGSMVKYDIDFPKSAYIWHQKFDDCLERLDEDDDSKIYGEVEELLENTRLDRDAAQDKGGVKTLVRTSDGFSAARDKVEQKFYSRNSFSHEYSFDFYEEDRVDNLPERQQDLWWVTHHLKTMSDKSETARNIEL